MLRVLWCAPRQGVLIKQLRWQVLTLPQHPLQAGCRRCAQASAACATQGDQAHLTTPCGLAFL